METLKLHSDDLVLLDRIVAAGTLAGAARMLELAPPAVTKRLAGLEARLGVRLVERSTRRLKLTAEGELAVAAGRELLAGLARLEERLTEGAGRLQGRIRLASTYGFGRVWVAPLLAHFQQQHPDLEITLQLADRLPDLATAGPAAFDAAVWLFGPRQPALVSRRLVPNRRLVVGAPAYLAHHGVPDTPADLPHHRCLVVRENDMLPTHWRLDALKRGRAAQTVRVSGPLASNFGEVVRDWCLAGHGLMLRSAWDVEPLIAAGRLVQVLPDWAMLDAIRFLTPPRDPLRPTPLRVRQLRDYLASALAQADWSHPPAG
ncbi:MAG: LysR family transcriptional regulator [Burkholderiaceae bacterium]|nr:LysR family transcriptional regulator [Burkholderiaceae bacterium]